MISPLAILAATDLSAPSRHAAIRAAALARQSGGTLDLVHVLEKKALAELRNLLGAESNSIEECIRQQAVEAMAQTSSINQKTYGINARSHLIEGSVTAAIIEQANLLGSNLLVVWAHGSGFMRHWPLGATAERLLRRTLHPILVVKQSPRDAYQNILVPVDFSPWSVACVQYALSLSPKAQLILLHAFEIPFEGKMKLAGVDDKTIQMHREKLHRDALARLHQVARQAGISHANWLPLALPGNPSQCILEQEEEHDSDLIVLGKHGKGMTEELLLGSVTKHVLSRAKSDVLVTSQ